MVIDYYEILQISPTADLAQIKTAYRKLAQLYHPDKNPGSKYAKANFEMIKEAYETLTKPALKEKYLQERWLAQTRAQHYENKIKTPETILKEVLQVSQSISSLDMYRMNRDIVFEVLLEIINPGAISILNEFNEQAVNDTIIKQCLQLVPVVAHRKQFQLLEQLLLIQSSQQKIIKSQMRKSQRFNKWERLKPFFIVLLVALLCLLIWIGS